MGMGFLGRWRARRTAAGQDGQDGRAGRAGRFEAADRDDRDAGSTGPGAEERERGMAELFAECGLLRELAWDAGVRLDDSVESLTALDQLLPRWRDDPVVSEWLGNDVGLYLGSVLHREVAGSRWRLDERERPLLVLPTGAEVDVTAVGRGWAEQGSPQLATAYLALANG
ncbi:DUF6278 family protein [Kitasatospora sp. NPDC048365]|uniref:DUF6278 family protein n=1 Tax=Kitasatospora sp. NPDC048365 TaxID=3364050 RepID=UPI0037224F9E